MEGVRKICLKVWMYATFQVVSALIAKERGTCGTQASIVKIDTFYIQQQT